MPEIQHAEVYNYTDHTQRYAIQSDTQRDIQGLALVSVRILRSSDSYLSASSSAQFNLTSTTLWPVCSGCLALSSLHGIHLLKREEGEREKGGREWKEEVGV